MKKIPSLFQRKSHDARLVHDFVTEGCEWVLQGNGTATRKFDGTACAIIKGQLYKRYDNKKGTSVEGGVHCGDTSENGKDIWWAPLIKTDYWHKEAIDNNPNLPDGTYELCGPKVQGNPEHFKKHTLVPHGKEELSENPRTFEEIRDFLSRNDIEGIVWHNTDGKMAKITQKKFGLKRKVNDCVD